MRKTCRSFFVLLFCMMTMGLTTFMTEEYKASPRITIYNGNSLEVSGDGEVTNDYIWNIDKTAITEIIVKSGITGIGNGVFRDFTAVKSVSLASSVTRIGEEAFTGVLLYKQ